MNIFPTTRDCIDERYGLFFDPIVSLPDDEELQLAKQLIEDAHRRGLTVTLGDLGIRTEVVGDTTHIVLPLPPGVI